jgi:hypothetical protein
MASAAQIAANIANAQLSTGPRTEAGKAAVAQNRATHGLAGSNFFLLPHEDPAEFAQLLAAYETEHQPAGPTESFLVRELAQSEWKLRRVSEIEAGILAGDGQSTLCEVFLAGSTQGDPLLKLSRYENGIRRNLYRALNELRALRREKTHSNAVQARLEKNEADNRFTQLLEEATRIPVLPVNDSKPIAHAAAVNNSKPMPVHLERELAAHRRRDPLFDPKMDASQMSKELRKWFERYPA